jgi:hypothetical protein
MYQSNVVNNKESSEKLFKSFLDRSKLGRIRYHDMKKRTYIKEDNNIQLYPSSMVLKHLCPESIISCDEKSFNLIIYKGHNIEGHNNQGHNIEDPIVYDPITIKLLKITHKINISNEKDPIVYELKDIDKIDASNENDVDYIEI